MIELRGTIRNLAKWFRLFERLVDRSPRMERNTDTGAMVAGGPTSTGVLTRGQMARALREGSLGETRSGGTGGGVIGGAISRVGVRKYLNNKYLRVGCGGVTLAMLMAAVITVAPVTEIPRISANAPSSDPQPAGSIPDTPGPSVGDGNSIHPYVSDVNQGHQKKMLNKITSVTAAAVVGIAATVAGAQGVPHGYAKFAAATDTIRILGNTVFPTTDFTYELCIRISTDSPENSAGGEDAGAVITEQRDSVEHKSIGVTPSKFRADMGRGWNCGSINQTAVSAPYAGDWHHIAWVRTGSVSRLYIDGAIQSTWESQPLCTSDFDGSVMCIGKMFYGTGPTKDSFIGDIDWIRINSGAVYTRAFVPPLENSIIANSSTQLLLKFNDQIESSTINDESPNHFVCNLGTGGTRPTLVITPTDCNNDSVDDYVQILAGTLADVNTNSIPDVCELGTCVAFGYPGAGSPTDVPADLGNIFGIAAGENFSLAIRADGRVTGWGANELGQCNVPTSVGIVRKIACGYGHSLAIQLSGQLVAWGANQSGQLNVPPGLGIVSDIAAGADDSIALTVDGVVHSWGAGGAAVPPGLSLAKRIGAGWGLGLAIHLDGALSVWGNSPFGGTNIPATLGSVVDADASYGHVAALRTDGSIMCWGYNNAGQCNVPGNLGAARAVTTGSFSTVAILPDGTVRAWGAGVPGSSGWPNFGQSTVPANLGPVVDVNAGGYFTLAMVKTAPVSNCLGDIYVNRIIDGGDLGVLLSEWGVIQSTTRSDLNGDNVVNGADLGLLLTNWGPCGQ